MGEVAGECTDFARGEDVVGLWSSHCIFRRVGGGQVTVIGVDEWLAVYIRVLHICMLA